MSENSILNKQYGSSSSQCDFILKHQLKEIRPSSIVDFGAGAGKNSHIVRGVLGDKVEIVGIEGCLKTAEMLSEKSLYNEVHHNYLQDWVESNTKAYSLALFGDVIEHLKPREIHNVIKASLKCFEEIIIVCPLHDIFQDEHYDNPLEEHQTYVTSGYFNRYNWIEKHIIKDKEWTIMNVRILAKKTSIPIWQNLSWKVFHIIMLVLQPIGLARIFVNILKRYFIKFKWLIRR